MSGPLWKPGIQARIALLACLLGCPAAAYSQQPLSTPTIAEGVKKLKPGQFFWAPEIAPAGPVMILVSLDRQLAYVYRNGVIIGISTASSGVVGHETPTGVFTVLQKDIDHKSNLYDNAPMPFMQRLTWDGIAMHAAKVPGYPASHGCIRLPTAFAKLLYGITRRGMTVVITDEAAVPRLAPTPTLLQNDRGARDAEGLLSAVTSWKPELATSGPVSIVISTADRRMIVLRNGRAIGSSPIALPDAPVGTAAYALRSIDSEGLHWLKLALPGQPEEAGAKDAPQQKAVIAEEFRRSVISILQPGATVVITSDTLSAGSAGAPVTVISEDRQ